MNYTYAEEVKVIASRLIPQFHPHLNGVQVRYVFVDKAPKVKGRETGGRVRKVTGLNAFLASQYETPDAEDFFVLEVALTFWQRYTAEQQIALVDHLLCYCEIDEDGNLAMRGTDVSEFGEIIKRHGLWQSELEMIAPLIAQQLPLYDRSANAREEVAH